MRRAGELLSLLFDEKLLKKAKDYSSLSSAWAKITEENGIGTAAVHSRIRELDRNVLLIEADHSGWLQIFQTRQHRLLEDIRRRFPDLAIHGISFRLSSGPLKDEPALSTPSGGNDAAGDPPPGETDAGESAGTEPDTHAAADAEKSADAGAADAAPGKDQGYGMIKDEALREKLRHLERSIASGRRKTGRQ
ncbi:MAG: DUF721 domain-containing protein [Treponema sp.]|jgi:hypothetical protein|nr:DUF721 domain-containing protein [Treponema sp.]